MPSLALATVLLAAGVAGLSPGTPSGPSLVPASSLPSAMSASAAPSLEPAGSGRLLEEVRRPGAAVTVVNVWATWCMPCREEFPDLLRLRRTYEGRGLRLLLVNADFEDDAQRQARAFLAEQGVTFPSFLKDEGDQAFIDAMGGRWSGALPATFVFDGSGKLREAWEGKSSYDALEKKIQPFLREEGKETTR